MKLDTSITRAEAAGVRAEAMRTTTGDTVTPLDVQPLRVLSAPMTIRATLHSRSTCACEATDDAGNCTDCGCNDPPEWVCFCGVASATDVGYEMWDAYGPYTEVVAPTAFDLSLTNNPDTVFLANHTGLTMARTVTGDLLLTSTPEGLAVTAWANYQRNDVHDLTLGVRNCHINQMSFSAYLRNGEWSDDATTFTMTELDLNRGDVSAVNLGANPHTSIAARSHRVLDEIDRLPAGVARVALGALQARLERRDREYWSPLPLTETVITNSPARRPWTCSDISQHQDDGLFT